MGEPRRVWAAGRGEGRICIELMGERAALQMWGWKVVVGFICEVRWVASRSEGSHGAGATKSEGRLKCLEGEGFGGEKVEGCRNVGQEGRS